MSEHNFTYPYRDAAATPSRFQDETGDGREEDDMPGPGSSPDLKPLTTWRVMVEVKAGTSEGAFILAKHAFARESAEILVVPLDSDVLEEGGDDA